MLLTLNGCSVSSLEGLSFLSFPLSSKNMFGYPGLVWIMFLKKMIPLAAKPSPRRWPEKLWPGHSPFRPWAGYHAHLDSVSALCLSMHSSSCGCMSLSHPPLCIPSSFNPTPNSQGWWKGDGLSSQAGSGDTGHLALAEAPPLADSPSGDSLLTGIDKGTLCKIWRAELSLLGQYWAWS